MGNLLPSLNARSACIDTISATCYAAPMPERTDIFPALSSWVSSDASLERLVRCVDTYRRYCKSNSLLSFQLLLVVAARAPVNPRQIAKLLNVTEAGVSVGLDNLGAGSPSYGKTLGPPPDLISKVDHPASARMKLAALTPRGSQLVTEMRAALGTAR